MISERERMMLEFHRKFGCPRPRRIVEELPGKNECSNTDLLMALVVAFATHETRLGNAHKADPGDSRLMRAKLMVSELGEVLQALAQRDELELADGLADLEYVVTGTAVTYLVPLGACFDEVHRSNMTKSTVESAVANHTGDRGKGSDFQSPDLLPILRKFQEA